MASYDDRFRRRFKRVPTVEDEDFLARFFTLKTEEHALVPVDKGRSVTELVEGINETNSLEEKLTPITLQEVNQGFDALEQHYKQLEVQKIRKSNSRVWAGLSIAALIATAGIVVLDHNSKSSSPASSPPAVSSPLAPAVIEPLITSPIEETKAKAPEIRALDYIISNLEKTPEVELKGIAGDIDKKATVHSYENTRDDVYYHMKTKFFLGEVERVDAYISIGKKEFDKGKFNVKIVDWKDYVGVGMVLFKDGKGYFFRDTDLPTVEERTIHSKAEEILQKYYKLYPEFFKLSRK